MEVIDASTDAICVDESIWHNSYPNMIINTKLVFRLQLWSIDLHDKLLFVLTVCKLLWQTSESFLVADTQLFKRLCPSIRRSISNDRVEMWKNKHFCECLFVMDRYGWGLDAPAHPSATILWPRVTCIVIYSTLVPFCQRRVLSPFPRSIDVNSTSDIQSTTKRSFFLSRLEWQQT